jgi:hypothetical protein
VTPWNLAFVAILLPASFAAAEDHSPLDLHAIPISDWLNAGEHADIPWSFIVGQPQLRVDQRLEVAYTARLSGKNLNRSGPNHELFLISRISTPDGEWLNEPQIVRHRQDEAIPNHVRVEFLMHVAVQPGDYTLWAVLYDRKTGKHNLARRHFRVPEIRNDPLPDLYRRMALAEFPDATDDNGSEFTGVTSRLYLPVRNKRPLQVELISMLSPPEQWTGRTRLVRAHNDATIGALAALSQMELAEGSLSITGLDLIRRQVIFEQRDFKNVHWTSFIDAMKRAQSPDISMEALQGSRTNGAFFREFLNQRLNADSPAADAMRVIIVVTSSRLFESGSDLRPLQIEGDCNCRVYYLRFRLNINDVFDQLDRLMKPLRPRIFNLITARDLRKAIAEIVDELGRL